MALDDFSNFTTTLRILDTEMFSLPIFLKLGGHPAEKELVSNYFMFIQ